MVMAVVVKFPEEVSVHLTEDELACVDALLPRFSTRRRRATRAEVLRALAARGLDVLEAEEVPPRSTARLRAVR
jgi:hypothetical protein